MVFPIDAHGNPLFAAVLQVVAVESIADPVIKSVAARQLAKLLP